MSVYLLLDSTFRDVTQYPLPSEFVFSNATSAWTNTRTVQCVRPTNAKTACNLVHTVALPKLVIPNNATLFPNFLDDNPYLYVSVFTGNNPDINTINTMGQVTGGAKTSRAQFTVFFERAQGTGWFQYRSDMVQTIRWNSNEPLNFKLLDKFGDVIAFPSETVIDPANQITCLLSTTPYVRDAAYDNHLVTLYEDGNY